MKLVVSIFRRHPVLVAALLKGVKKSVFSLQL